MIPFKTLAAATVISASLFAAPAVAQNIIGPSKITSVTSTIPNGNTSFPLVQINDTISTNGPHNGFQGVDQPNPSHIGTITFTLDQSYDLDAAWLWNDINVRAEGVNSYTLKFFDASNNLVGTVGPLTTVAGQVAPHVTNLAVANVKKVEMVVHSILNQSNTFARRVEIREVAFNGKPTPQWVDVPGDHFQCYAVAEAPALKPVSIQVRDQFGKAELVLARPIMLCNPSIKVHRNKKYGVQDEKRHLVCYLPEKQSDQPQTRKVKASNQFAIETLVLRERKMFCVPSLKKRLDAPDQSVALPMD